MILTIFSTAILPIKMPSVDIQRSDQYMSLPPLIFDDNSPRSSFQNGPWATASSRTSSDHTLLEPDSEPEGPTSTAASFDSRDAPDTHHSPGVAAETKTSAHLVPSKDIKGRKWFGLRDWLWELGAAALSVSCTVVIVAVLYAFQDRALSSWQFVFQVSLNSFVSILSGLSRTSLLVSVASCISQLKWIHFAKSPASLYRMETFDLASRGPWGALMLLWRMNFKAKLAAMASLITIL